MLNLKLCRNVLPTKVSFEKKNYSLFLSVCCFSVAGRRGMSRDRFGDRYSYGGRGGLGPRHGGGSSGHTPTTEEPSSVTRKKTPLQQLHQKAGVSTC